MDLKEILIEITLEWNKKHNDLENRIPMEFITFVLNQVERKVK